MSVPVEVVTDYRDFFGCGGCGYEGIGTVSVIEGDGIPRETVGTCDICERQTLLG